MIQMIHSPIRAFLTPQSNVKQTVSKTKTPHYVKKVIPQPLEKKVFNFDNQITEFEIQAVFSGSVLFFSMAMLITKKGDPSVYLPLITSVLGFWAPSPKK
ncbi:hypothetical protein BST79_gp309 [Only Syngen Nebraska virus 5]|uniref:hypothetical protein n=1 Tax=Only Syngen Nebraska virus 5 TaxID=1917232 RepID=UPI000901280A|nr:hypothetical protein BST79_gp309 [Only Syngen Nebraska virus 5]APC25822.1 hypothetical protein [Only Syngen Nebraska virus 5]